MEQIHFSIKESTLRIFARKSNTNIWNLTHCVQQVPDDERVPVRKKFQGILAGVGMGRFVKNIDQIIQQFSAFRVACRSENGLTRRRICTAEHLL